MRHFGNINLQQNKLLNPVLDLAQNFPPTPKVGQLAFVNKIVYVCVQDSPAPAIWIPLTREITAYSHVQAEAALEWTVQHNLNTMVVNVQIYDENNRVIIPDEIQRIDPNTVKVNVGTAAVGTAVVVSGHLDGGTKPTYAYTFYQTESATTWTINHNLGYHPIVRVFIGTSEVQPESISHPSISQTVVTFSSAQVGVARLI